MVPPHGNNRPIFILGIMQRSGTNYFRDLLALHPHCTSPDLFFEDNLTRYSSLLFDYAARVRKSWEVNRKIREGAEEDLLRYLGEGLLLFLKSEVPENQRVLVKTPRVENLPHFFKLFPRADLLILIRDGRALVESGMKGFGWNFDEAAHKWAEAAQTILNFDQAMKGTSCRYLIVKYEDLVTEAEKEMRRVLNFLELSEAEYNFEAARRLPVRGSSLFRGEKDHVHWDPLQKKSEFEPLQRWRDWGPFRRARFNWVAGDGLRRFGYKKEISPQDFGWQVWNRILDGLWLIQRILRSFLGRLLHG